MAAKYFLIACNDEPPRSFNVFTAAITISPVGGCVAFAFGFLAAADADAGDFATFATFLGGDDGAGVTSTAGTSDILFDFVGDGGIGSADDGETGDLMIRDINWHNWQI